MYKCMMLHDSMEEFPSGNSESQLSNINQVLSLKNISDADNRVNMGDFSIDFPLDQLPTLE